MKTKDQHFWLFHQRDIRVSDSGISPKKHYKKAMKSRHRPITTYSFSRKIVSFLVVFLFLLSGVFVSAQTMPRQIYSMPLASPSDLHTSTPSIPSGAAGRTTVPLYVLNSNPECCNRFVFTPATIREMYNSTALLSEGITGKGVTIAIVDAFGDPNIRS